MSTAVLVFLLIFSVSLNIMFVWYIRRLIQEFANMSDNVDKTSGILNEFADHLESLYDLETYYGDESLKSLIRHSREILEEVKGFETVISLIKEAEEGLDEEED